jgi:K+-sensing histidine kinase KdpD
LHNYLNTITSARYGNLNSKVSDGVDTLTRQLSKNTNALLESIADRDKMIMEYIEKEKERQNLKQDFISGLTHDLKVPIIAQDNTYDLLLNEYFGKLTTEQQTAINNLKVSNNDLKKLILNLLDVQKYENNSLTINKEETELNELINEILKQDENIFKIQNKNIIFNSNDNRIIYSLDKFLIKRVINNLISNAISHSKHSDTIKINLIKTDKNIEIQVTDEGDGINKEDIKNIFEKYYTSAKKYSNTSCGLGLYISNKIILAHNGKIDAKNNSEKGATFTIYLPL